MILVACCVIAIEDIVSKEIDSNILVFDHKAIKQGFGSYGSSDRYCFQVSFGSFCTAAGARSQKVLVCSSSKSIALQPMLLTCATIHT